LQRSNDAAGCNSIKLQACSFFKCVFIKWELQSRELIISFAEKLWTTYEGINITY
jgi:hypothetical protein